MPFGGAKLPAALGKPLLQVTLDNADQILRITGYGQLPPADDGWLFGGLPDIVKWPLRIIVCLICCVIIGGALSLLFAILNLDHGAILRLAKPNYFAKSRRAANEKGYPIRGHSHPSMSHLRFFRVVSGAALELVSKTRRVLNIDLKDAGTLIIRYCRPPFVSEWD
jgi:hypothetical protein